MRRPVTVAVALALAVAGLAAPAAAAEPPPPPVIESGPSGAVQSRTAAFTYSVGAGLTAACALDGAAPAPCDPNGITYADLADGPHTFAVRAVAPDSTTSAPATASWTVDYAGPAVTIDVKPPALTRDTTLSFAVSSDAPDVAAFHCMLEFESVDCADGTVTVTVPATSHPYRFWAYATDHAGNAGETAEYAFYVDFTTPSGAIHTDGPSLTAPRIVSWDELVTNVTPTTVRIVVRGTTTRVPVSFACRDHANVVVPCTGATVREAVLTPVRPLVPGQHYTFVASGVTDRVGNVMERESATFRASTTEQESSAGATARWRTVAAPAAAGGSYVLSDVAGAAATYRFHGSRIVWYGRAGPAYGTADVYVDGVHRRTVSFYAPATGYTYRVIDGLADTRHTLRIRVRGERGSPAGTGAFVAVDAFRTGGTTAATPAARYAWAVRSATDASGGRYAVEDNAGATYAVRFRGTAFTWVTALGPSMGKAAVTIDGRTVVVDNYAPARQYRYAYHFGGLTDSVHTATVTVLGRRRAASSGTAIVFDRFGVT